MRESPRFFGQNIGLSAQEVYDKWEELGLIEKHISSWNSWGWQITDYEKSLGGKLSDHGTPTFDFEKIKHLM